MAFELDAAVAALSRTPNVFDALLGDLDEAWVWHRPGPGEWSAAEVLGHFIHGERTDWLPRARIILAHGATRPFDPFDRDGSVAAAAGRTAKELLATFRTLRMENIESLLSVNLTEADLDRTGTHPAFGAVTLRQLLATWTTHDHVHLAQLTQALATAWTEDVGPWRAYLWE
jgi:DinB superfamily